MEIITCDQFKMTEEIHDEVMTKMGQIKKHLKGPALFKLQFHKKGQKHFSVEINMNYKGVNFRSESTGFKFFKAFNETKSRLIRQVKDHQEKKRSKRYTKVDHSKVA